MTSTSFATALHSAGPAGDRADQLGLYGWLIGDWTMDAAVHLDNGTEHRGSGEIHFGWVLEGRAIQDVWIFYTRQIGRAAGKDIVQLGKNDMGEAVRWSFTEITPDSFCWTGERSRDDGQTWHLQAKFLARRVETTF
jgi:hypothetical protein